MYRKNIVYIGFGGIGGFLEHIPFGEKEATVNEIGVCGTE